MAKILMNKVILIVNVIFMAFGGLLAQKGQGGTESNFEALGFGARAIGMGQAFTSLADDPTAVFWNPSGLEYISQQSATFFHTTLFTDVQYDFLGYVYPTLNLGTFGIGLARLGVSGILGADNQGNPENTFSHDEYRLYMSYAKKLPWDLSAGISVKALRYGWNNLSDGNLVSTAIGGDLGLMYRPQIFDNPLLEDWSIGVDVRNLFAPQLKEEDQIEEFPLGVRLGVSRKIRFSTVGAINLLFDVDHSPNRDLKMRFGSEYDFKDIGSVRVGYNGSSLSFGLGGKYSIFQIDYGYSTMEFSDVFPAVHRISLSVNFGLTRDDMLRIADEQRRQEEERIKKEIREADRQEFVAKHLEQANKYFDDKKFLDAIVEYQQVISADPFNHRATVMLDSSNKMLQRKFDNQQSAAVKEAIDKERAESDSMFVQTHFEKGRLLLDKKQYVEALIEFNLALERDPNNEILKSSIATTKRRISEDVGSLVQKSREEFKNQNYAEALRLLADARLLGADDAQLQNEIETLASRITLQEKIQQGLQLYDVGEYDQALKVLQEALSIDPNNPLVQQYMEKSRIETATQEDLDPETEKKYNQGIDYFMKGNYAKAIQIWEEILKDQPYNKKVLRSISSARERLKNAK